MTKPDNAVCRRCPLVLQLIPVTRVGGTNGHAATMTAFDGVVLIVTG